MKQVIYGFLVKNPDLDSNLYNLKKRIKKASKILKLTPTPEPYRCAGLKLTNKYYKTDPNPKRPYSWTRKANKSNKVLTWFLDLLTRLAHPGSVGPQFFSAETFSPRSIYPDSSPGERWTPIFFGGIVF
jgi:hypothetical protein